ncbi:hypothetical protein Cgig2_012355 [Carnegiea gigantea]|uniref:Uncharacterized protein n=1 Tax=Carnegiea gigantea TaxID=171969 RepID=A0A9Q1QLJ0_9CARY|nr:hypothetical protein Cgig2_012355 [Carnegiea gigantea]
MTAEQEQVDEKEHHNKGVEDKGKAEDQIGIQRLSVGCFHQALFQGGRAATDWIITNIRRLAEVITELEELIPGARTPLKRVRKVVAKSVSDALIKDTPNRSKSKTPILSQDSFELEGFLKQIDVIEKHFAGSRDKVHDFSQFAIPSFSLGVSQEKKGPLSEGIFVVDSQPNSLAAAVQVINCDVKDVIQDVQTTTNTNKGKAILVKVSKRRRMRSAQSSIT